MEHRFWHDKWAKKEIGFHLNAANPLLVRYFPALGLPPQQRIFLPLCGKTRDIAWLRAQGHQVIGAELSETAICELFKELELEPKITDSGEHRRYCGDGVEIFVGDFFALSAEQLGRIDAVYDRAALVALPAAMRARYTAHLRAVTHTAPQLLICFEYDQTQMDGPPFSIDSAEVQQHYAAFYTITALASPAVEGGLKGVCAAIEPVWLLQAQS